MNVPFSYLKWQFANPDRIWKDVKKVVLRGDFTLGKEVAEFEGKFAKAIGTKYAVGVNSGTDALFLSLKALGIGAGDEVITMTSTFIATVGAIAASGAKPVFVDCNDEYVMNVDQVEKVITPRTKAIMPVHYAGHPVDMPKLMAIAKKYNLEVVEDACQSVSGAINGQTVGSIGITGGFSLHPLKNINVWSDAGVITTNSEAVYRKLLLLRNHGMKNRDEYECFGYNSRLDTVQAAVGLHIIKQLDGITKKKIEHAAIYDKALRQIPQITVPQRRKGVKYVYHLYIIQAENRDGLLKFLNAAGIEAKVHYPMPLHVQNCCKHLGYKAGDFPVAESQAKNIITLPAHQHLSRKQIQFTIDKIKEFYKK
ncbi:MAG: transcriptional regulator [Elusimicrobia bacterium RIFCSPLOWO2_01_FULL_54_10]|nr:MAG: transcriptional regulator [Elusimicrobia bacterium RIFCSPLOWO2_01_FULL_54_10]